jgi:hypothetical protein
MHSVSAYGEAGPDKVRESFVLVAYWARGEMRPPVGEFGPVSQGLDVQLQTP